MEAVFVEVTVVMTIMLVFVLGSIEFLFVFYQWNVATKAVQIGARIAAVSDPVAAGLNGLSTAVLSSAVPPGAAMPHFIVQCDGAARILHVPYFRRVSGSGRLQSRCDEYDCFRSRQFVMLGREILLRGWNVRYLFQDHCPKCRNHLYANRSWLCGKAGWTCADYHNFSAESPV